MSVKQDISGTLRKIQKEIQQLPNITDRLNFILDMTLTLFGASTGSISIMDQEEKVLTIVAAKGMDWEKKIAAKLPLNLGVTGRAASSREIIYVPDVTLDKDYVKLIETVRSELAIPLLTRDSTVGVLNLESDKVNFFSPDIINQATLFASQLTIVILEERIAKEAFEKSKREEDPVEEILGYDPSILFLKHRIRQVGPSDISVMIIGEEGSGKKLVAKALHYISQRKNGPFSTVDCSGLSYELLEAELFGSYSGKIFNPGKLEQSNGGSLYIESIGDLPSNLQTKLFQTLRDKTIPNPNTKKKEDVLNIRIFSGSKRDLLEDIQKETFSMDLYYRLAEVPLRTPPLRERRGDIPLLAHHYLYQYNKQYGKNKSFSSEALKALTGMPWSGNVRQLQSVIQYAVIVPQETVLEPYSFQQDGKREEESRGKLTAVGVGTENLSPSDNLSLNLAIEKLEAIWIREAFQRASTQEEAAKLLGISRGSLQYKIKNNQFLDGFSN
ncbi:sigma-54-dependent Fis family transcriptional regulator [Leptospira bouyouniensis]|uniref:Sigma-54-dependent Fis family transcriptional regulator n=1 Tax=Leptospira bouyouniensis TaxID=2484911 RepID=A0A7I0IRC0_9LEPT|nr:sigma 54-interacting transcriptional regulator [Leptospira bouyouniensis]TGL07809.1 sigma-54-dependent Fis family transcriptional regulator [Leptospira bouyouniensis]